MSIPSSPFNHGLLEPLDDEARIRVLTYIACLLGIDAQGVAGRAASAENDFDKKVEEDDADEVTKQASTFSDFAQLYAATHPKGNGEEVLVAGYWLQVCQEPETFTGAAAKKELTHLGHKVANITMAVDSMKKQKPMLILQVKKSGGSRQARKLYKVSHEGINRVVEMIGG